MRRSTCSPTLEYRWKIPRKGHIDFAPIFDVLNKIRYDGDIALEAILSCDPRQDLIAVRKHLERLVE